MLNNAFKDILMGINIMDINLQNKVSFLLILLCLKMTHKLTQLIDNVLL